MTMQVRQSVRIECDLPECAAHTDGTAVDATRIDARNEGWVFGSEHDYCPTHADRLCRDRQYEVRDTPGRPPSPPSPVCRLDTGHVGPHTARTMRGTVTWPALNGPSGGDRG